MHAVWQIADHIAGNCVLHGTREQPFSNLRPEYPGG
jgi:hypothetical protein